MASKQENNQRYYEENKHLIAARRAATGETFRNNLKKYGLTPETYKALREKQMGLCAACLAPTKERGSGRSKDTEHIDHDHVTGEVRGLLCVRCNVALGMARDDPQVLRCLLNYLEK